MKAWITARQLKAGSEDEFRRKWSGGGAPDGMVDAYLLQGEDDPRHTLSVSLWDTAESLLAYRTSKDAHKRDEDLSALTDSDGWNAGYVAWNAATIAVGGGRKKWAALPVAVIAAAATAFLLMRRRNTQQDDDAGWQESAGEWQPVNDLSAPVQAMSRPTGTAAVQPVVQSSRPAPVPESPQPAGDAHAAMPSSSPTASMAARAGTPPAAAVRAGTPPRAGQTVREVMTANPETVDTNTDAATAAQKMRELNVGILPVMAGGRVAGVITDRDLAMGMSEQQGSAPKRIRVGDLMTTVPVTIAPGESVEAAAKLMADHQIRRLLVMDGAKLSGILSLGDIATDVDDQTAGAALEEISEPARPQR